MESVGPCVQHDLFNVLGRAVESKVDIAENIPREAVQKKMTANGQSGK